MNTSVASWLAWAVCAFSLALTALCFLLIALILSLNTPIYFFWLGLTVIAIGYSVIGAIIATRLPKHPIGWICCAIGFIAAVDHFGGEYAVYALLARSEPLPGGQAMLWLQSWFWMLFVGLLVFLLLLFPNGRLPSSRWRPFAWVSVTIISVGVIYSSVISPDVRPDAPPNPMQQLVLLLGLVAAASVVVGRRGARGVERQQIKWLLYAGAIIFVGPTFQVAVSYILRVEGSWAVWVGNLLGVISGLGIPIAIGVAILRYKLYEIDILINRTLVYGSLTALLALVYFGGVATTQAIVRALTGQEQQPQLSIVVSTLVIAALFNPLRRRIQSFIDRRFYRRKYDAAKTLAAFTAKLRDETNLEQLTDELLAVLRDTIQPTHASVWLRPPKNNNPPRKTLS
jgi:MFS family permease